MARRRVIFSLHAFRRMIEREITDADVLKILATGATIEEYPDDMPYPSRLMTGWINGRCLHVVAASHQTETLDVIITVYQPDPADWERPDFRRRRRIQ